MDAKKRLQTLKEDWQDCRACDLGKLRPNSHCSVFGSGEHNADVMIITDAPTAADMGNGGVLTTADGVALQAIIKEAGLPLKRVYVTSLVGCYPYVVLPATDTEPETKRPRSPNKTEIQACQDRLHKMVYAVDPRLIVALGETVWHALVPSSKRAERTIADAAGVLYTMPVKGQAYTIEYPVLAVLSIKQIIGNPSTAVHGPTTATTVFIHDALKYVNWLKAKETA